MSSSMISRTQIFMKSLFGATTLLLLSSQAMAFNIIHPNKMEWDAWPKVCQGASHTKAAVPRNRTKPKLSRTESALLWKTGGWHYCIALLKLHQLELGTYPKDKKAQWLKEAMDDINYSLERISLSEPWAGEMLVAKARTFRQAKKIDNAKSTLDKAMKNQPQYAPIYTAYAVLFFDEKDFPAAIKVLESGNKHTKGRNGELLYFLGLAYLKNGDFENARIYEKKARAAKYPMRYLTRQLQAHDYKQKSKPAKR